MERREVEFEVKTGKSEKDLENLGALLAQIVDKLDDTSKGGKDLEDIGKGAGKSKKGLEKMKSGLTSIGNIFKATGVFFIATKLFEGLSEAMNSNQRVIDGLAIATETVSVVFNQVSTALFNVYDRVTQTSGSFDAMGKVLSGLITIGMTPLKMSFYAITLGVKETQLAWEKSFFGDNDPETIKQLQLGILETKANIVAVGEAAVEAGGNIINNFGEAVDEVKNVGTVLIDELDKIDVKKAISTATDNVNADKNAKLATARNRIILEQKDREAEKLRQIRDDESQGIAKRIQANKDLAVVLKEQETLMLKNADAILAAAQAQFDKNGNDENALALLEAKAEKEGILAQMTGLKSEQMSNANALERENLDIQNELALIGATDFEAARAENDAKLEEQLRFIDQEVSSEEERTALIEQAKANHKVAMIEIAEDERQQQLGKAQELFSGLQNIATAFGKESKALAIAGIVTEQVSAISKIISATGIANAKAVAMSVPTGGMPWVAINSAMAGVSIAGSIAGAAKAIRDLKSNKKTPSAATGMSSTPRGAVAAPPPEAPDFNIVGSSSGSQIAQAMGGKDSQPIKAYVVSDEVTTAQSLDRNIIKNASIG